MAFKTEAVSDIGLTRADIIARRMPAPFASRPHDSVVALAFPYDPELIASLKQLLREYRAVALDPGRNILCAGGWHAESKQWWIEPLIWPQIKTSLLAHGYHVVENTPR